ncbi:hypothetical protein [Chengkuizengella axinellae]|uniref:Alpha/beta hydrolase n=1 Tax=Chengkuizengella axinellae TaxID=3064388 RepID=A0ABT9IVT2_9BACL|nr:hypothetical protein [Chengkuizengella sp. 2205SS18-9]MDP5272895.1 hypothetical protein [Chengkuizengella sp. 2205SS18-9]
MKITKTIITNPSEWGTSTSNVLLESKNNRSLLVLFPGKGYHCDKPLLYFAQRVGVEQNCDVLSLEYGFQAARTDFNIEEREFLIRETSSVIEQTIAKKQYERVYFISKSIGTVIAGAIGKQMKDVSQFYLTPSIHSMTFIKDKDIVVVGSIDPMFTQKEIDELQKVNSNTRIINQVANNLEAKDIKTSLDILFNITEMYREFLH